MKRIISFVLMVVILATACVSISGCGLFGSNSHLPIKYPTDCGFDGSRIPTTTPTTLNARQQAICEDLGLSPIFESLTPQQKKCIVRIEELLQYLDNKYDTTFNYLGYKEAFAPVYQKEKLEAYTEDTNEFEYTTLTVGDDGSFVDDYPFQLVKPIVRYDFIEYMQRKLGKEFKVYGVKGETEITDIRNITKEALSGTTVLSCTAFVEQSDDLDVTETGNAIADWYKSLGIYGNTTVIAINSETFDEITYDNYESIRQKKNLERYLLCKVSKSGNVKID